MECIQKLAQISSSPLGDSLSHYEAKMLCEALEIAPLAEMYALRNGMFAFYDALHLFPITTTNRGYTLQQWNDPSVWKSRYRGTDKIIWFAENIFGEPYGLHGQSVLWLDLETGKIEKHSESPEQWADKMLLNYRVETGYPVSYRWQNRNRNLKANERLVPIRLLSMGGSYEPENFNALDALDGIDFRANIYEQIRDLPDGTPIRFEANEKETGMRRLRVVVVETNSA